MLIVLSLLLQPEALSLSYRSTAARHYLTQHPIMAMLAVHSSLLIVHFTFLSNQVTQLACGLAPSQGVAASSPFDCSGCSAFSTAFRKLVSLMPDS
jgi:hypothetical protein